MKLMIASDIHGSAHYCRLMLDAFASEQADRLVLLGDILYHGPRNDLPLEYAPKQVIAMLNEQKERLLCVRGNCDTEVDQMVLQFPVLSDSMLFWTQTHTIFATHGHVFNLSNLPPLQHGDVLLHGHTHVPAFEQSNGITYINPGSVSIPKESSLHSYIILENDTVIFKDLESKTPYRVCQL